MRKIFTLLELLIVIAIIAILSAMLLPALSKARNSAQGIVCRGNLKELNLLIQMYVQDSKEYWVPKPYMSEPYLLPYLPNRDVFNKILFCPAAKEDYFVWYTNKLTYLIAAKNTRTAAGDNVDDNRYRMLKMSEILRPSQTGTMVDGSENWVLSETNFERLRLRHDSAANILYCDGHIEKKKGNALTFDIFIAR